MLTSNSNSRTGHLLGSMVLLHIFGLNAVLSPLALVRVLVSLSLNSTYFFASDVSLIRKSPNLSLWCSSRPLIPMCIHIISQIEFCKVSGSSSPRALLFQSCSKSSFSSGSEALDLFHLPSFLSFFRAAVRASLERVNWRSSRTLYYFPRSSLRCLSMLLWKEVSVSGS